MKELLTEKLLKQLDEVRSTLRTMLEETWNAEEKIFWFTVYEELAKADYHLQKAQSYDCKRNIY